MKPSEMSREELASIIEHMLDVTDDIGLWRICNRANVPDLIRNSIPKPEVEVGHWVGDLWVVTINGTVASEGYSKDMAESHAKALRTALGLEG